MVDIVSVALMLYYIYRLMRKSRSLNVFVGILVFILIWLIVSQVLEMRLLGSILDKMVGMGAIAIVIIFQEDIRKFLYDLGTHRRMQRIVDFFFKGGKKRTTNQYIMPLVMACVNMARSRVGALVVIERSSFLGDIVSTGETIDALVNQRLIENIFFKNSPLHDGAMVIQKGRIKAAGCILPVSHDVDIPKELGLRHRAALGMSEESDAICVVASEETGKISVALGGKFYLRLSSEQLESMLREAL